VRKNPQNPGFKGPATPGRFWKREPWKKTTGLAKEFPEWPPELGTKGWPAFLEKTPNGLVGVENENCC